VLLSIDVFIKGLRLDIILKGGLGVSIKCRIYRLTNRTHSVSISVK